MLYYLISPKSSNAIAFSSLVKSPEAHVSTDQRMFESSDSLLNFFDMPVPELIALQLQTLLDSLDELPYCTGTVPLDCTSSRLYYQSADGYRAE